jgi:preprotein translocase subunit YajC
MDGHTIEMQLGGLLSVASIVFFLGLGYLTYFFVSRKMEKEEEENENDFTQG